METRTSPPGENGALLEAYLSSRKNGHDDASAIHSLVTSFDMDSNEVLRELELAVPSSTETDTANGNDRDVVEALRRQWRARREQGSAEQDRTQAQDHNQTL